MIVERTMDEQFLANTYLVGPDGGGDGFYVDAHGDVASLVELAARHGITPTHLLLTHHHWDHVDAMPQLAEAHPGLEVLADERELEALRAATPDLAAYVTGTIAPGDVLDIGGLHLEVLHIPGHTAGMLGFLVEGELFTGDTLFKGSVGGVRAPGHTTYADLKSSIMDTIMSLPDATVLRPGHTDPSTVGEEREHNRFIRVWRGLDPEGDEPCTALGEPATLVLLGDDYDGGHKAWIRWPDGRDDIVPGSKVERG
ncbi:MAG TPA: MBL fold metallo-hydrolase [Baekduia sp.]|nr:MBL fold metallo-hydrolase [Baekduia sp.]